LFQTKTNYKLKYNILEHQSYKYRIKTQQTGYKITKVNNNTNTVNNNTNTIL